MLFSVRGNKIETELRRVCVCVLPSYQELGDVCRSVPPCGSRGGAADRVHWTEHYAGGVCGGYAAGGDELSDAGGGGYRTLQGSPARAVLHVHGVRETETETETETERVIRYKLIQERNPPKCRQILYRIVLSRFRRAKYRADSESVVNTKTLTFFSVPTRSGLVTYKPEAPEIIKKKKVTVVHNLPKSDLRHRYAAFGRHVA